MMTIRMAEVPQFEPPMSKRRRLEDAVISGGFARLSEAMYMAEQKAQEAVTTRWKAEREMVMREKARKEQESSTMAQKALFEGRIQPSYDKMMNDVIKRLKILMENSDIESKYTPMKTEEA